MHSSLPSHNNHSRLVIYGVLLAVVVVLMVLLGRCRQQQPLQKGHSGGDTVDVAIEYAPVTYYMYGDTLGGFNYDLLRLLSLEGGRPFKFHPVVGLQAAFDGMDEGRFDVVVAQFPVTRANKSRYLFTEPVYIDRQVLVQRRDSTRARSQLDLAGDTVFIVAGSPMAERIASLGREIGDTIHVVADAAYGPEQLVLKVAAGEVKRAVVNRGIAQHLAQRLPGLDCSVDISMSQFQSWVVRRDRRDLCDSINVWLKRVKTKYADDYHRLQQRYSVR